MEREGCKDICGGGDAEYHKREVELKRVAEDGRVLKTHTKPVQCLDLIL